MSTMSSCDNDNELLVLCQLFHPELVSTGQALTELCEELSNLGLRIEVLCAQPTIVKFDEKIPKVINYRGICIHRVWSTRFNKLHFFGRVINQLTYVTSSLFYLLSDRKKRPIMVLTNPPFISFILALFNLFHIRKPFIYVILDVYPDTLIKLGFIWKDGVVAKTWYFFEKLSLQMAGKIVVIGRCMESIITNKAHSYGIDISQKTYCIHNWADDRILLPYSTSKEQNKYVDQWELKDKFILLYSGNMGRFHDMETIMETAFLLKEDPTISFVIVGEGHKKSYVEDFVKDNKLKNVKISGYVKKEDLPELLGCADVGLVSLMKSQVGLSVPSKAFGIMAIGIPVIAIMPAETEIARIIAEEHCGLIIEPGDSHKLCESIQSLKENTEVRQSMGSRARKAISDKYNLKDAAMKYFQLIKDDLQ